MTAYLLDTEIWSVFSDTSDYNGIVDYVIGGPPLDLWVNSFNDTHPDSPLRVKLKSTSIKLSYNKYVEQVYDAVYDVNDKYAGGLRIMGNEVSLYNAVGGESAYGYWMPTPDGGYTGARTGFWCGTKYGRLDGNLYDQNYYDTVYKRELGLRPIVRLKCGVSLEYSNSNKYSILK